MEVFMKKISLLITILVIVLFSVSLAAQKKGDDKKSSSKEMKMGKSDDNQKSGEAKMVFDKPQKEGVKAICPVTGESFVITKDTLHSEYKGKHVYFCCPSCKGTFDKEPEKYLKKQK